MGDPVLTGCRIVESTRDRIVFVLYGHNLNGANPKVRVKVYPGRLGGPHAPPPARNVELKPTPTAAGTEAKAVIDRPTARDQRILPPAANARNQTLAQEVSAYANAGGGTGDFTTTIDLVDDSGPPSNELTIHWDQKVWGPVIPALG